MEQLLGMEQNWENVLAVIATTGAFQQERVMYVDLYQGLLRVATHFLQHLFAMRIQQLLAFKTRLQKKLQLV